VGYPTSGFGLAPGAVIQGCSAIARVSAWRSTGGIPSAAATVRMLHPVLRHLVYGDPGRVGVVQMIGDDCPIRVASTFLDVLRLLRGQDQDVLKPGPGQVAEDVGDRLAKGRSPELGGKETQERGRFDTALPRSGGPSTFGCFVLPGPR